MNKQLLGIVAAMVFSNAAYSGAPAEGPEPTAASAHVANAKRVAREDLSPIANGFLCRRPSEASQYVKGILGTSHVVAARAFDNLYYVGSTFVGSWILTTDDGLILWDAMNNEKDASEIIEPQMRALGLDPAQIKVIIVTHGHYDHFGGARHFQDKYGAHVMMSAADWDFAYDEEIRIKNKWPFVEPPRRDLVINDGDVLKRGGATIRFVLTPGHTPGTVSSVFTVKDGGEVRYLSMWGGTAMPNTSQGLAQYHDSLHKLWSVAREAGAVGGVSTHPFVDDTLGRLVSAKHSNGNPFVLGTEGFDRFMEIHDECVLAQSARYQSWGW